ncbi:MAG: MMPL family transporter [Spirochaetaceae bacterium]|nr:MMPL family transporter [Spirochaetaceae bacterium]
MKKFFKYPVLIIACVAALTVFFAVQLPRAELDNNNYRFVPESDPARVTSARIDSVFGSSLFILVGLEREYGSVLDGEFLKRVREYVERVKGVNGAGKVDSIINTSYITADGDAIRVESLAGDDFSGKPEEIAELRRRLLSWNVYEGALVSSDFTATQIRIPLEAASEQAGGGEVTEAFYIIRDAALEMFDGMANVYVAGLPVISAAINESVKTDVKRLVPLVVIVVLAILFFSFRRFSYVAPPLISVIVAAVWSTGAAPLLGVKLSILSTVLPVILVAVGSAYGIHVVTHYISDLKDAALNKDQHRDLVFELFKKIGKPVLLAALTTFSGFASLCFTAVPPIREFGILASLGVMASFAVAVTLIPALLLIRGPKPLAAVKQKNGGARKPDPFSDAVTGVLMAVSRKKRFVIVCACALTLISLYGVSKVIIDNAFVEYFKPDTDVRRSDVFIREKFGGSKIVNVVVEADDTQTLLLPEVLCAVDGLQRFLSERAPEAGKVMGFTDMIKRTNQVFNADESPLGLKPAALRPDDAQDASGFGFDGANDADFGFGEEGAADFGFGGFSSMGGASFDGAGASPAAGAGDGAAPSKVIDVELLDRAAASSGASVFDFVWEIKKMLNYEGAAYYETPSDPARYGKTSAEELSALVSNYLVLISSGTNDYSNDPLSPTAIRTVVQLRTTGDADTKAAVQKINAYIEANFPKNVRVSVGGSALVESALSALVVRSQVASVAVSILMVFIIVAFSYKSLVAGFVAGVPLFISILINFAAMGFLGIKLNLGTALVASVSVGIGIDYAIHFIDSYKREYSGGGDFLRRAFSSSGKAIIINAVSVGLGFAVLYFSQFNILSDLGLLVALTMFTSSIISLTVIPALLSIINPRFIRRG